MDTKIKDITNIMGIKLREIIDKMLCIKVLEEIRANNLDHQNIINRKNREKRRRKKNRKITIYQKWKKRKIKREKTINLKSSQKAEESKQVKIPENKKIHQLKS